MIGSGLKKYAAELGINVDKGIAYGVHDGYMITLKEGSGWKSVTFAVTFPTDESRYAMHAMLHDADYKKSHRITDCQISSSKIEIIFFDNPGTMKRLRETVSMVYEKLHSYGILGEEYCNYCGQKMDAISAKTVLHDQNAFKMHYSCVDKLTAEKEKNADELKQTGSVLKGALGAFIAALISAVPWGIAYYFGWFTSAFGILIGFGAAFGYDLLKGKQTKAKTWIILVAVLITVVVAEYAASIIGVYFMLSADPIMSDITFGDAAYLMNDALLTNSQTLRSFIADIVIGWLFAILGASGALISTFKNAKSNMSIPEILD